MPASPRCARCCRRWRKGDCRRRGRGQEREDVAKDGGVSPAPIIYTVFGHAASNRSARRPMSSTTTSSTFAISSLVRLLVQCLLVVVDVVLKPFRRRPSVDLYYCDAASAPSKAHAGYNLADLVRARVPALTAGFREAWWLPV